jgi:hypothetical protein
MRMRRRRRRVDEVRSGGEGLEAGEGWTD